MQQSLATQAAYHVAKALDASNAYKEQAEQAFIDHNYVNYERYLKLSGKALVIADRNRVSHQRLQNNVTRRIRERHHPF